MPNALIVDDSRTARYVLRQLLSKQQISADMVESAEEALEYLEQQRPDLIFMDHMMPGMDGFQAVKLIKSNPATRNIPIVMYTSSHGGVYFGQARALGAADVISKPATARDLQEVLKRLAGQARQVAEEGDAQESARDDAAAPVPVTQPETVRTEPPRTQASLLASGEPGTSRAAARDELREDPPAAAGAGELRSTSSAAWWLAGLGLAATLVLAVLYAAAVATSRDLQQRLDAALAGLQWGVNQAQEYPYGEPPLAGERLARLQELLTHLQAMGFEGTVRVEAHVGEFCLREAEAGGALQPAAGDMPITECSALGQSESESLRLSQRTTSPLERFLENSPLLRDGRIAVELDPQGALRPSVPYPTSPTVSAEVWNRAAQQNNRVVFELISR
ncbi:MAG: response regulator [Spongiibacteraceae bacterium]|jgi:CheY-like chemotaxis protein|nr:response regulator [Spongiibacteraceae bacterium]